MDEILNHIPESLLTPIALRIKESGKTPLEVLIELALQGDRCSRQDHDKRLG